MAVIFRKTKQDIIPFIFCLLGGILIGRILLLDVSNRWKLALLAAPGILLLMLFQEISKQIFLFMLAFALPFLMGIEIISTLKPGSMSTGISLIHLDALALGLLFLLIVKVVFRQVRVRFFALFTLPALTWLAISMLSFLPAKDGELVAFGLIAMGKLFLLYWVIANSIRDEGDVRSLIAGFILGLFFEALLGVYQGVTGHPLGLYVLREPVTLGQQELGVGLAIRVPGTFGHPNAYAAYLTSVIPFALALMFTKKRTLLKVFIGITLCLSVLALVYTLSRNGWISLVLIFGIAIALATRCKRIRSQTAIWIVGITLLIVLGLTVLGPPIIRSRLTSDDAGAAYSRIPLAQTALAVIKDHPLLGVGLNNYLLVLPQYDISSIMRPIVVHNIYLYIAAETGLFGLAAFLVFIIILLIQAWRIIIRAPTDLVWVAGVGIFSTFIVLSINGMADYAIINRPATISQFWLLAGLAAVLIYGIDNVEQDPKRRSNIPNLRECNSRSD